jgi:hypothetical protein
LRGAAAKIEHKKVTKKTSMQATHLAASRSFFMYNRFVALYISNTFATLMLIMSQHSKKKTVVKAIDVLKN